MHIYNYIYSTYVYIYEYAYTYILSMHSLERLILGGFIHGVIRSHRSCVDNRAILIPKPSSLILSLTAPQLGT